MKNIDAVFKEAETLKDLPLRSSAWRNLEQKLDQRRKKRRWQIFSVAASRARTKSAVFALGSSLCSAGTVATVTPSW